MRAIRWCAVTICIVLVGCKTLGAALPWPASTNFTLGEPLLQQLSAAVEADPNWFAPLERRRRTLESRYTSEQPRISPYLEGDIYLYADGELSIYLDEILDGLLDGFAGPRPDIGVIVETNTRFSAYVDEMGLIHVSTGLLRSLRTEDQLAGVLAHELAHFLLRHNLEKHSTADISRVAGIISSVGQQLVAARQTVRSRSERERTVSRMALGHDSFGLLWADLMAPLWSRENEREADRLAMDLMHAAGYNQEELLSAIARIHDATASRSTRIEKVSAMASGFIDANRDEARERRNDELGLLAADAGAELLSALTSRGLDSLDEAGASHDDKAERIDTLKRYLNAMYVSYELPPEPRSERFTKVVLEGAQGDKLRQDLAAVETLIAVGKKNLDEANRRLATLSIHDSAEVQISTALAVMSMEVASRNYDAALEQLTRLVRDKRAPAEVFIKLAKLQAYKGRHAEAARTLAIGSERIGRSYRFLPTLIDLNKAIGDVEASEKAALECAAYDGNEWVDIVGLIADTSLTVSDTYYEHCATRLGYDVKSRRLAERRQDFVDLVGRTTSLADRLNDR